MHFFNFKEVFKNFQCLPSYFPLNLLIMNFNCLIAPSRFFYRYKSFYTQYAKSACCLPNRNYFNTSEWVDWYYQMMRYDCCAVFNENIHSTPPFRAYINPCFINIQQTYNSTNKRILKAFPVPSLKNICSHLRNRFWSKPLRLNDMRSTINL